MADREKVIKGMECCGYRRFMDKCDECPYDGKECFQRLKDDALELLKAQEPVKPTWKKGYPLCGECGFKLHWIIEQNNYCANCGRAVKWDA